LGNFNLQYPSTHINYNSIAISDAFMGNRYVRLSADSSDSYAISARGNFTCTGAKSRHQILEHMALMVFSFPGEAEAMLVRTVQAISVSLPAGMEQIAMVRKLSQTMSQAFASEQLQGLMYQLFFIKSQQTNISLH